MYYTLRELTLFSKKLILNESKWEGMIANVLQGCHKAEKAEKDGKLENGPNFEFWVKKLKRHSFFSTLAKKAEFSWNMKLVVF